jgi:molybdopterin molybdotransferase
MSKEFFKVLEVEQVLDLVAGFSQVATEEVDLAQTTGRVLAEDVLAAADLPGFARSTVDGYALQASATFGASESNPALLQVVGSIAMGQSPRFAVAAGEAARIATGGMLPEGADAVLMLEHVDALDESTIEGFRSVAPGQNLVAADEDFARGARVARRGQRMRPQDTGVLAAVGRRRVAVYRQPRVAIISTGDEVVDIETEPGPGRVRDVNSYTLAGLVAACGALPVGMGIVRDDRTALRAACDTALSGCDMVLVSGGSSVGARDFTVEIIGSFGGAAILAHGIAISPGKPTIVAKVRDRVFFGLPGHVVSAMIVFARIVRPFLGHIGGLADPRGEAVRVPARLSRNVASVQGRTDFIRVRLNRRDDGLWAQPVLGKSALIHTMITADGIIEVGKNVEGLEEGAPVEVMLF